jgi:hypothetical protein
VKEDMEKFYSRSFGRLDRVDEEVRKLAEILRRFDEKMDAPVEESAASKALTISEMEKYMRAEAAEDEDE